MRALALILLATAHQASAEPCVSATFDTPLPGATDVVTRQVDVPSPQVPGIWQEGILDGYFYALYANGDGVVRAARKASGWEVKIQCEANNDSCATELVGTPPPEAQNLALVLGQCLRGEEAAAAAVPEVPVAPCGVAAVPEGSPVAVLQNLLVAAGADPGPVDGLIGAKTRDAVVEVLGAPASALDTAGAISALDAFLCRPQE